MIRADMDELLIVSRLFPDWTWSSSATWHVIVAADGAVLRLYSMPLLLRLDSFRAELFVKELNMSHAALM